MSQSLVLGTCLCDNLPIRGRFCNTDSLDELHQNGMRCTDLQTHAPFARSDIDALYRQVPARLSSV